MSRIRVRASSVAVWRHGPEALGGDNKIREAIPLAPRIIGAFGDRIVTFEHSQNRLVVAGKIPIDLPPVVNIASSPDDGKSPFILLWTHGDGEAESASMLLVNVENGSVTRIPFPGCSAADIHDGIVDATGEHVATFDATRSRLWCWTSSNLLERSKQQETAEGQWRSQEIESHHTSSTNGSRQILQPKTSQFTPGSVPSLLACGTGVFTRSSLLGHCFTFVRASWELDSSAVVLDKWLFDVDADWAQTASSSRIIAVETLRDSLPVDATQPPVMRLRLNSKGNSGALTIKNILISIKADLEVSECSVPKLRPPGRASATCMTMEQPIADIVWLDKGDTLALLLAQGQVAFVSGAQHGSLELIDTETHTTSSKRLCLNTLMGRAVAHVSRLFWIKEDQRMLVQTTSGDITFTIEVIQEHARAELRASHQLLVAQEANEESLIRRRRRRRQNSSSDTRVDDELRRHLSQADISPNTTILIDTARIALYESRNGFQDVFFLLLGILLQQLKSSKLVGERQAKDAQALVNGERRRVEALLSLILSSDFNLLQKCSTKMLSAPPAFTSMTEQRSYYQNEMCELSILCRTRMEATLDEDQVTCSRLQRAFLSVYQSTISGILTALVASMADKPGGDGDQHSKSILAVCHLDEALESFRQVLAMPDSRSTEIRDSKATTLALMFASYAIMCSHLRIPRVCMDLQFALSIAQLRLHKSFKVDQLACYITNASHCRHFEALPSASNLASTPRYTMESALEFARASQSFELLVDFCSASTSPLAHECLKQICVSQAKLFVNSKDIRSEMRVEMPRQSELTHLQICEHAISEMLGLLRELPLVLHFKHSIQGAEAITLDAFELSRKAIEQRFEMYLKSIITDMDGNSTHQTHRHGDDPRKYNHFWKHASREVRVWSRCLRLKTRILWHLRQFVASGDQSLLQIFERIFLIDFLSGRCGNPEEAKLVAKFIDKAQDAVSCSHWQRNRQTFNDHQQPVTNDYTTPSHLRRDKIIRSVALIMWVLWVRERCAYCLRSIELLQKHEQLGRKEVVSDAERARIGSLAATCALQLNALRVLVGKPDDIFSLQISLLEESAKLNREKAVAVICWAFPPDKVQARYLKRYKALRQTLKADASKQCATETITIEETEQRCQFIQRHVKKSIRWSTTSGSMKPGSLYIENPKEHEMSRSWTFETDVLVDCCCDLEFQKLTWALIQKRFVGDLKSVRGLDEVDTSQLKKALLQGRASIAEGAITRQEVMALLEEQRRNLEGKVRLWSMAPRDHEEENIPQENLSSNCTVPPQEKGPALIAEHVMPSKRIVVRDIDSESDSISIDAETRKRMQSLRNKRYEPVQNVLKLLNLRKQNGAPLVHTTSSPDLLHEADIPHFISAKPSRSILSNHDTNSSPTQHAREASVLNSSSATFSLSKAETHKSNLLKATQQSGFSDHQTDSTQSPVFPLRHTVEGENAAIQLLNRGSSGGRRAVPLKARRFSFQGREQTSSTQQSWVHTPLPSASKSDVSGADVTSLKSAEAQTDEPVDTAQIQVLFANTSDGDCSEKKNETATQADKDVQCAAGDSNDAAVQCNFDEKRGCEVANVEEVTSSVERVLSKFPIFIDLDPSMQLPLPRGLTKKKYLQVARFTDQRPSDQDKHGRVERVIDVSPGTDQVETTAQVDMSATEFERDQANVTSAKSRSELSPTDSSTISESRAAYQTRYRSHYSTSTTEFKLNKPPRKSMAASSGQGSLLGLKEDMERLRIRLARLEHCADEIDEDFKSSHHQLDRIGREHDNIELARHSRLLDTIDDVVAETTTSDSSPELPRSLTAESALSRKASKDVHAAWKLIEAIEEMTLDGHDDD